MSTWLEKFSPRKYLSRINLNELLPRNALYSDNLVISVAGSCLLCDSTFPQGLVLSNREKVCPPCFEKLQCIELPEKYERLKRGFVLQEQAWSMAKADFDKENMRKDHSEKFYGAAFFSLVLLLFSIYFLALVVFLWALGWLFAKSAANREITWLEANKKPEKPVLKGFHDAIGELTEFDKKVVRVFLHWPGYPPFWKFLREVVLERDKHLCQINGCPSRSNLHVHHVQPISKGGQHHRNNLISLCEFHHALQPDEGHERIWERIKTEFFTLVPSHRRRNRSNAGRHIVKAHLRRLKLVDIEEIASFHNHFEAACPDCGSSALSYSLRKGDQEVVIRCKQCGRWETFERLLAEETCPLICLTFKPQKNLRLRNLEIEWAERYKSDPREDFE